MYGVRGVPMFAALLIGVFLVQSYLASRTKSAVYDEPTDIAAGLSYLSTGVIRANPQHPPLIKELAGLFLRVAGYRLPDDPQTRQMVEGEGGETRIGAAWIAQNGADRVMAAARLPMILVAGALGLLLFLWGRQLAGETAALAALFLYAVDPTLLAHSFLVTMDTGLAAFTLLFFFALWNYVCRPDGKRLVWCGLALGAVLAVKFSAVFLLPVAAVLLWAGSRTQRAKATPQRGDTKERRVSERKPASGPPLPWETAEKTSGGAAFGFVVMCLIAVVMLQVFYLSSGGAYLYSAGMERVNADHDPNHLAFLAGSTQARFPSYFLVAYLLKEPLPAILLAGFGLVVLLRSRSIGLLTKLFLLLPPAVLMAVHSLWADDLGIRYIIPVLPFAWLIAGVGVARLLALRALWPRVLLGALAVWLLTTAAAIYPDHLAYFNEAACLGGNADRIRLDGGALCGTLWLDDSNVDWGQGLKQLKEWAGRNSHGRNFRLAYFGTMDPVAYGVTAERIGLADLIEPKPGLYVVSAHFVVQAVVHGAAWLANSKPVAVIGHSLYVYER